MICAGIDLSLVGTGVIVLKDGKIEVNELIKSKPAKDFTYEKELERIMMIRGDVAQYTKKVDIAVIEGLAFMARNSTALVQLAALNYMVREVLYKNNKRFIIVAPTTLKKFITGKGNCPKDLMMLETYKRYGVSLTDDNRCDAYCLARIGEALLDKGKKLTKFQEEVINLLKKQL